jgi:hypothetical protein
MGHQIMRRFLLGTLIVLVLAAPARALASTPTDDVYDPLDQREHTSQTASGAENTSSGLAFTGLDVGLVVLAGVAVLGTGIALRRATRSD